MLTITESEAGSRKSEAGSMEAGTWTWTWTKSWAFGLQTSDLQVKLCWLLSSIY